MTDSASKFVVSARAVFENKAKGVRTSGRAGARFGYYVKHRHTSTQLLEEPNVLHIQTRTGTSETSVDFLRVT